MSRQYDEDAYNCLMISIITGVGASKARKIYECRQSKLNASNKFAMEQYKINLKTEEKEERKVQIKRMKENGKYAYS
ncbi:MAG: hypothetical protein ACLUFH_00360 [Monoglobales bacterium]